MNALQVLQQYGFPKGIDNTRIKPVTIYDSKSAASVVNFFTSAPALFVSNKQLPLANDETLLLDRIKIIIGGGTGKIYPPANFTSNFFEAFTHSYFEVVVNETQKIKIPLVEILNFNYCDSIGNNDINFNIRRRSVQKSLQYPIIIYKNSNVSFRAVLSANAVTALTAGSYTLNLELSGVKLDFVSPNDLDPVKNQSYEKVSATLYNTVAVSAGATTYNLFTDRTTSENMISKFFPLSESEVFSIEAVEVHYQSRATTSILSNVLEEIRQNILKISINSTDFYLSQNDNFNSLIFAGNAQTFTDATPTNTNLSQVEFYDNSPEIYSMGYKGFPIIVPSQTQVSVTLQKPSTSFLSNFITVMLKGTLERRIS
ncbi:MAG: hypothetical protein L6Q47_02255 [Ignavibacteriaceae bacterium]|nr:hypothetical protein [Ignavibacteriaceae bacterium]